MSLFVKHSACMLFVRHGWRIGRGTRTVLARFLARIIMDNFLKWTAFKDIPGAPQNYPWPNVPGAATTWRKGEEVHQHRRRVQRPSANWKVETTATTTVIWPEYGTDSNSQLCLLHSTLPSCKQWQNYVSRKKVVLVLLDNSMSLSNPDKDQSWSKRSTCKRSYASAYGENLWPIWLSKTQRC